MRWAPLSPRYRERKRARWGERPILQASGQLRRAASDPRQEATPSSLTLIIDDAAALPARAPAFGPHASHGPVAQHHQEGEGHLPRRPIVGDDLPPLAALELERSGAAYVDEMLGRLAL